MASGDLRRQAIFAAVAESVASEPTLFLARAADQPVLQGRPDVSSLTAVADVLAKARARDVVQATYGTNQRHFLSLLRRIGSRPLPSAAYARLHALAAEPADSARIRYLLHCQRIAPLDIDKAERLRPEVLSSKLVRTIRDAEDIDRVNALIDVALRASSTIDQGWLAQSLSDVADSTSLTQWLFSLVERFDRPLIEPPFPGDDEAILLNTARSVLDAARRYRNCMRTMLTDTLSGQIFFYEFPADRVIVLVKMLTDGTGFIEGLYGLKNRGIEGGIERRIRDKLAHVGLPSVYESRDRQDLKAIASLPTPWTFRDIDDDGDD